MSSPTGVDGTIMRSVCDEENRGALIRNVNGYSAYVLMTNEEHTVYPETKKETVVSKIFQTNWMHDPRLIQTKG